MGIVIALLIFGLIVTVHEFGHFICAKMSGINVIEFSIGMGPKIIQKKFGDTMYSLRLLPVGGYCSMEGEDSSDENPRSFRNAKLWKRMLVLVAGALMNFILGFVMIVIMSCMMPRLMTTEISGFSGVQNEDGSKTYYAQSYHSGLRHDDEILKIDGTPIFSVLDINLVFALSESDSHDLVVRRNGERLKLDNITFHDDNSGNRIDFGLKEVKKTPLSIASYSGNTFLSMGQIVITSLKQLVTGKVSKDDVSGPVGIVSEINETTKEAKTTSDVLFTVVYLTAMITINIGIFNLLPIPGLDGGRLIFCLIELIRRKPVKPEHEGLVHLAGMILLFMLMILITFNDIMNIIKPTSHQDSPPDTKSDYSSESTEAAK